MAIIKYLGPCDGVEVHPYGLHVRGQKKEYPDPFGIELLATSKKQRFERVDKPDIATPKKTPSKKKKA